MSSFDALKDAVVVRLQFAGVLVMLAALILFFAVWAVFMPVTVAKIMNESVRESTWIL